MWYSKFKVAALVLPLVFFNISCGKKSGGSADSGTGTSGTSAASGATSLISLSVLPLYPNNGAQWNDYVIADGTSDYSALDNACVGNEALTNGNVTGCIHGGEKRKVVVTGKSSCSGLTASDSLGAFEWRCFINGSSVAEFRTVGFNSGKGLGNLLTASGWLNNSVTVSASGTAYGASSSATWYTNAIAAAPANSGASVFTSLSTAGTIYVVSASTDSSGYEITADRVGFVVLPGATLTYSGKYDNTTTFNVNQFTGVSASADKTAQVFAGGRKFLWIEGSFNSLAANTVRSHFTINLQVLASRVHKVTTKNTNDSGVVLVANSYNNRVSEIKADSLYRHAVFIRGSSRNFVSDVTAGNLLDTTTSGGTAVLISSLTAPSTYNAQYNRIVRVRAFNSRSSYGGGVTDNPGGATQSNNYFQSVVSSNTSRGVYVSTAANDVFSLITAVNGFDDGLRYQSVPTGTFHNFITANNGGSGAASIAGGSTNLTFTNGAFSSNGSFSIYNSPGSTAVFSGSMLFSSATSCVGATANQGFNGTANSCAAAAPSTYNQVTVSLSSPSLVFGSDGLGKVNTTDSLNGSNSSGASIYSSITDWTTFSSLFRAWGLDGTNPFADSSHRWVSNTAGANFRIWDFSLYANSLNPVYNKTGNGSTANNAFVAGATCPTEVSGNTVTAGNNGMTYLTNAVEIIGDSPGNNNGLCETGDTCLYTPNFGAYQGSGTYYTNSFIFTNGTVSGVTMYAYPVN